MRKPVKYVLLGLLGLIGLVIIGAVVFAMTFDPNRYKDDIERIAKERTGRTLRLKGNLEVAVYPALGAKVNGVSLTERNSDQQFLELESAHASVALLPLLRGEVIVDRIRVAGLKAQVVRGKDGRWNFDDLVQGQAEKPGAQKPAPEAGGAGGPVKFDIAGISLERSSVAYKDLASGQEIALSDLELSTGRIAERADGKLKFSATAKGRNPDLDAKLQLAGQYRFDLPAKSYALSGFEAQAKGMLAKEPLEVKVSAPRIQISADSVKGDAVSAELKMKAGERSIDAKLKLGGVEGSAKALSIPQLSADVALTAPDLPQKTVQLPITGSLRADLEKQTADADLALKLDESNIQAKLGLAKFSPAAYVFDINVDRLNVDRYFPPSKAPAKPAAPAAKPAPAQVDTPVDLSALKDLNASGKLSLGALQVRGLKLANVRAQLRAANGRMDVSPHSADLYEGSMSGAMSLQANGNRVTLKESLSKVAVGPLLKDLADKDLLEGRGNIVLDVTSAGASVDAMKKALAGSARLNLRDGAIKGFNLAEIMRKARTALGGSDSGQAADKSQRTDFTELNASFTIKNGVAHNEDLDVKAPLFRITGSGDVDVGNSRIDYVTKATVVATAKGQGGAELQELSGITVPVRLTGTFDDLKYQVDYRSTAADIAKTKAGEKVKERLGGQKEKLEERLGGKLKGLLGR